MDFQGSLPTLFQIVLESGAKELKQTALTSVTHTYPSSCISSSRGADSRPTVGYVRDQAGAPKAPRDPHWIGGGPPHFGSAALRYHPG